MGIEYIPTLKDPFMPKELIKYGFQGTVNQSKSVFSCLNNSPNCHPY